MLADFSGREAQLNLFDECAPRPDSEALMNAVDRINRAGKGRIFLPARDQCGVRDAQEMLSPEYTTDWNALPRAFMR
jgi:DNA polymerase V